MGMAVLVADGGGNGATVVMASVTGPGSIPSTCSGTLKYLPVST